MCVKSKRKKVKNVKRTKVFSPLCATCKHTCKDCPTVADGECKNYSEGMCLEEMNSYADKNFVKYVCLKNNLNISLMNQMLKGKIDMKNSYYSAIVNQIIEKDEYLEYIDKFENNFENNEFGFKEVSEVAYG